MTKNYKILYSFKNNDTTTELYNSTDTLSVFQMKSFYDFFNSQSNNEALYFSIQSEDKIIMYVIVNIMFERGIKKAFSKRAIIYGGPVINKDRMHDIKSIIPMLFLDIEKKLREKGVIYLEIRNLHDYSMYLESFQKVGFFYEPYLNYRIDISNIDATLMKFKAEKRRQVRKALKNGANITTATKEYDVIELYKILYDMYRNKVKKPLPDLDYFLNLWELFKNHNNGFITLVKIDDKIIGGSICPHTDNTVYDWYRGGLDQEYRQFYPSTVAAYAGMYIGNQKGLQTFDFMGAGHKNKPYGVRNFKSQFGGTLLEYGRFIKIYNPLLYKIGTMGINILRKIK